MDVTPSHRLTRTHRLLFVALFVGIAWATLSVFLSTSSASASHGEDQAALLDALGQTPTSAASIASDTSGVVDRAAASVTTAVISVAQPAVEHVPAPVSQPVVHAVDTVTHGADHSAAHVDHDAVAVVNAVTSALGDAAAAGIISTGVAPVVDVAESLPTAGDALSDLGVGSGVLAVAASVDTTTARLVGPAPPIDSLLPELPLSGVAPIIDALDPDDDPPVRPPRPSPPVLASPPARAPTGPPGSSAPEAGVGIVQAPSPNDRAGSSGARAHSASSAGGLSTTGLDLHLAPGGSPSDGAPLGAVTANGGPSAAGQNHHRAAIAGAVHENHHASLRGSVCPRAAADDALPGAPVFDTDISPD